MQEILNKSLNLGVSFIVGKLGNEQFTNYFYNFGIADRTGIDLPNEAKGLADNLKSPRDVEHATASFGQGIALSPMSMTRALATLGNGGFMVTPHLVKEIEYTNGLSSKITPPIGSQVIKKETSQEITRMLVEVVDTALMDGKVKMEHYSIAAKTGTAQMARESGGGYYTDRYLHSFFGYFPAYDPQFLVFLYTVNPKNVEYASHTLTDPFINITKFLINYYQIPPDR
jgi:cell division protein FtsI/penicillin-binding protein 2